MRHLLRLSNGALLFVEEDNEALHIGLADRTGEPEAFVCEIGDTIVSTPTNSGDAAWQLCEGLQPTEDCDEVPVNGIGGDLKIRKWLRRGTTGGEPIETVADLRDTLRRLLDMSDADEILEDVIFEGEDGRVCKAYVTTNLALVDESFADNFKDGNQFQRWQ